MQDQIGGLAIPSEVMVTLQKVIWFVGCVLKVTNKEDLLVGLM